MAEEGVSDTKLSRRAVLGTTAAVTGGLAAGVFGWRRLADERDPHRLPPQDVRPSRDWDNEYRDIWDPDEQYMLTCTPNDTHNCYLEASVKNGVITRLGPSMNYGKATDIYGNEATERWDPRVCQKGLAMIERFYGEQRVKAPMVREGFLEWVEDGFPRDDDGSMPEEYARRGEDGWVEVSFDQAYDLAAETILEIAEHYSGDDGMAALEAQGYDEALIEETGGAGVQSMKFRGGMPLLGMIRLFGMYRFTNQMALVDHHIRDVDEDDAIGSVGLDNYSWHTDLPPGHTMVTGQQTIDFDLANVEYADHVVIAGMNWLCTKMADSHWLTEARLKGTTVTGVFTDYNATATKCDDLIIVRPGTDSALFLGAASVIVDEGLYDEEFVRRNTDLPMLVRMDTGELLRAHEVIDDWDAPELEKTRVVEPEDRPLSSATDVWEVVIDESMRDEWGDFVVYDRDDDEFVGVTRDEVGDDFDIDAALEGTFTVETVGGDAVEVRPVFDLIKQHLLDTWTPDAAATVTGTDPQAVIDLAHDMADNDGKTLLITGMGPNHYNNQDQKDRTAFLLCSLTRNIGRHGGNIGSYAGNYRGAYFNGNTQWTSESPFDIELDPDEPAREDSRYTMQSAHWYAHGDRPLKIEGEYYMGDSQMPTPTKFLWTAGSNSILGNAKGSFDIIENLLRTGKIEALFTNEWWWTKTCEYSDIVFPCDSWAEHHLHDITASVTNPFVMAMPLTKIGRIYNTANDAQIYQGVSSKLAKKLGDKRFDRYWTFIDEGNHRAKPYLQRVIDHSNTVKGYDIEELIEDAEAGIPALIMTRTYPKFIGSRQSQESHPWYTKTGRLEFYREEPEFAEAGEHIPLHREPVDGTPYEPSAIVDAAGHPLIDPETPEDRGWDLDMRDADTRQIRNVVMSPDELIETEHPLRELEDGYDYIYMTPKYRHGAHTFANSLPNVAVWWGPFGDMKREDKRKPYVGEGYIEMNPEDARAEGLADGDYVYVDADPEDRPFRGWQDDPEDYHVARAMMRVRFQPAMPRGVTRSWFNLNEASHGTVEAHEEREDGLARNEDTNYQSLYRYGGHQSATRSWFRRTLLTDTLARKEYGGQNVGEGFAPDIHCANGAPKESFVRIEHAEDAGEDGEGDWRPAELGLRPGTEDDRMNRYLSGEYAEEAD